MIIVVPVVEWLFQACRRDDNRRGETAFFLLFLQGIIKYCCTIMYRNRTFNKSC